MTREDFISAEMYFMRRTAVYTLQDSIRKDEIKREQEDSQITEYAANAEEIGKSMLTGWTLTWPPPPSNLKNNQKEN